MFFSGTDIKVTLLNAPDWKIELDQTMTFPIRKHKISISKGTVFYFDYKTGDPIVKDYTSDNPYAILLGYFSSIAASMAKADYDALTDWIATMQSYDWGSGIVKLDAIAIQFSSEQSVTPIYTPSSPKFATVMKGNSLVQGAMTINFDKSNDRGLIQHVVGLYTNLKSETAHNIPPLMLKVDYSRSDLTKDSGDIDNYYVEEFGNTTYTLEDVRFMARAHGVQPDASAVADSYQFIAKTLY